MSNFNTIIKICGKNCNANFDVLHTRRIINMLISSFYLTNYDVEIMELIAGFTFAIIGDFDAILQEEGNLEDDKKQTLNNIDKLNNYLYGGYRYE